MGKIYILGNERSEYWARALGKIIPISSLELNDNKGIHNFLCTELNSLTQEDSIIIDLDSDSKANGALPLSIAMHIRLSVMDLKEKSFLPILLVSYCPIIQFLKLGECSQFFLSQSGYAFDTPEMAQRAINNIKGLEIANYKSHFLDCIQIHPDDTIGRHSMANQWGADVLSRKVSKEDYSTKENTSDDKSKLYYKYIYLKTGDLVNVLNREKISNVRRNNQRSAMGKKILLIDDEAKCGWASVLKSWLYGSSFDVIDKPIDAFEEIQEEIREKIEKDYYDLYFLDLRLLGEKEDDIYNTEDFSGMRILRKLKSINEGNQVIIMTASNKAWNMKALINAGADGYYIKESPEFQLPEQFSENNFKSFKEDVVYSLEHNGYKRRTYRQVLEIISTIKRSDKIDDDSSRDIVVSIESSLNQIMKAKTNKDFAYAYMTLFQILELICRFYVKSSNEKDKSWIIITDNGEIPLYFYNTDYSTPSKDGKIYKEFPSIKERINAICVEVGHMNDAKFIKNEIGTAIDRRNSFVHNDTTKLKNETISKIYTYKGFNDLIIVVEKIIKAIWS